MGVPTALGITHPCPAWLELSVPLAVGNARDLLRGAAEEEERESQEQAEEHAKDAHGAALPQGHLEPLQDGTTHHDADHRPRDVHSTWGKAGPCFPSSEPYQSLHYSEGPRGFVAGFLFFSTGDLQGTKVFAATGGIMLKKSNFAKTVGPYSKLAVLGTCAWKTQGPVKSYA